LYGVHESRHGIYGTVSKLGLPSLATHQKEHPVDKVVNLFV